MTTAIRQKATNCLAQCGINQFPVDVDSVAKHFGINILERDTEQDNVSGLLSISSEGSATIVVNQNHHINRKRFTIAHELGHYFLHANQGTELFVDSPTYYRSAASSEGYDPIEVEANLFAAELLMPIDLITSELEAELERATRQDDNDVISELASKFEVSYSAMSIRIGKLALA